MFWGKLTPAKGKEAEIQRHPDVIEMDKGELFLSSCVNILRNIYGFVDATNKGIASDKKGDYLPLYTYPATEYVSQFDYSQKRVFEFGAGASTLFWMQRAAQVVSIENNEEWYKKLASQVNQRVELLFSPGDDFPYAITKQSGLFDVIVVDGGGYRYDCANFAVQKLAPGGLIILDNADWHFNTAALLKKAGLLQVDMTGFKPCESHTSSTSLFFHREFNFTTLEKRQPRFGMGAKRLHSSDWDKPYPKKK